MCAVEKGSGLPSTTGSLSVVGKLILTWRSRHLPYNLPRWAWNVHPLPATCGPEAAELKGAQPGTVLYFPEYKGLATQSVLISVDETGLFSRILQSLSHFPGELQTSICLPPVSMREGLYLIGSMPFLPWLSTGAGT